MKKLKVMYLGLAIMGLGMFIQPAHAVKTYWADRGGGNACYVGIGGMDLAGDSCQGSSTACANCGGMWTGPNGGVLEYLPESKTTVGPARPDGRKPSEINCEKKDIDGLLCVKCDDGSAPACDFANMKK